MPNGMYGGVRGRLIPPYSIFFLIKFDVTIDITTAACYINTIR